MTLRQYYLILENYFSFLLATLFSPLYFIVLYKSVYHSRCSQLFPLSTIFVIKRINWNDNLTYWIHSLTKRDLISKCYHFCVHLYFQLLVWIIPPECWYQTLIGCFGTTSLAFDLDSKNFTLNSFNKFPIIFISSFSVWFSLDWIFH